MPRLVHPLHVDRDFAGAHWIKTRMRLWNCAIYIRWMNAHTSQASSPDICTPKALEQWLKQVIIVLVNESYIYGCGLQCLRCRQAAKSASHDDHARSPAHRPLGFRCRSKITIDLGATKYFVCSRGKPWSEKSSGLGNPV